jgi:hypothetical protein
LTDEIRQLGGLKPLSPDERDLKFGAVHPPVDLTKIAGIDFDVWTPERIKIQNDDDCTGFGMSYILGAHEDVEIDGQWQFALNKFLEGNLDWGSDVRTAFKAAKDFGGIEQEKADIYRNNGFPLDLRDYKNWPPEFFEWSKRHKQKTFFFIEKDSYKDLFDALRAALWEYRDQKHLIGTGALWRPDWTHSKIINRADGNGFGHFFAILGVKHFNGKPYIKAVNSAGPRAGEKGYHYFSREIVNKEFRFGSAMLVDMDTETAKTLNKHQARIGTWKAWFWRLWVHMKNGRTKFREI